MQSIAQRALTAVGLLCVLCWDAAPVHAADPAPSSSSIYDGQWSCEFRLVTKPGGTFVTFLNHAQLENVLFTAIKSSFQVNKNGSFSWEERKNTSYHTDAVYYPTGSYNSDRKAILKAKGQVVDAKTRTLKVTVEHWLGSGRESQGTIVASTDETSETHYWEFFSDAPPKTIPVAHLSFEYELKPVSIEQQDLGPDQQREIVTYRGSRGINPGFGGWKVAGDGYWWTEYIEIRQVRELKLVPRG
jgi:hypothetical protein